MITWSDTENNAIAAPRQDSSAPSRIGTMSSDEIEEAAQAVVRELTRILGLDLDIIEVKSNDPKIGYNQWPKFKAKLNNNSENQ